MGVCYSSSLVRVGDGEGDWRTLYLKKKKKKSPLTSLDNSSAVFIKMQMELVLFCLGNKKAVVTVNTQFVKGSQGLSSSPLCEPDRRAFLRRMEERND